MSISVYLYCASALLIKAITSQSIGNPGNSGLNLNGLPYGGNYANSQAGPVSAGSGWASPGSAGPGWAGPGSAGPGFGAPASTGGGFTVTSTSSIAPSGVSVLAENLAIEGPLSVGGQMPFLGSIGLEGTLQAIGSGSVSYGCGNGEIGITSEDVAPGSGTPGPYGQAGQVFGPGQTGQGLPFGSGLSNPGFGTGAAGTGFGAGLGGPGFTGAGFSGSGLAGFGQGLSGSGFGNGMSGTGFGAGLGGKGLG